MTILDLGQRQSADNPMLVKRPAGHLDELQKAEKYPIRWSLYTGFTGTSNVERHVFTVTVAGITSCDAYMRQLTRSSLIEVLVFHMFQAEPLSESLLACRDLDV